MIMTGFNRFGVTKINMKIIRLLRAGFSMGSE
jgi:hypothetical protein